MKVCFTCKSDYIKFTHVCMHYCILLFYTKKTTEVQIVSANKVQIA